MVATAQLEKRIDPRVIRTRQLLLDSFDALLAERRNIRQISIKSITEQAGVNRVTFYAHFNDKYELMALWKQQIFRDALSSKLPADQQIEDITFEQLIDTVLEFKMKFKHYFKRINKEYEPLFEAALKQEVTTMFVQILSKHKSKSADVPVDIKATFLSGAIFDSATEWSRDTKGLSQEVMVKKLVVLVNSLA